MEKFGAACKILAENIWNLLHDWSENGKSGGLRYPVY